MEINLILLMPDAMILGWQYHKPEKGFEFSEVNLFLFFEKFLPNLKTPASFSQEVKIPS